MVYIIVLGTHTIISFCTGILDPHSRQLTTYCPLWQSSFDRHGHTQEMSTDLLVKKQRCGTPLISTSFVTTLGLVFE